MAIYEPSAAKRKRKRWPKQGATRDYVCAATASLNSHDLPNTSEVMSNPYLVSMILPYVDMKTLLIAGGRVCKDWKAIIDKSSVIQRKLFLKPDTRKRLVECSLDVTLAESPTTSWRHMLVTQPPIKALKVEIHYFITAPGDKGSLEDHRLAEITVRDENGITQGSLMHAMSHGLVGVPNYALKFVSVNYDGDRDDRFQDRIFEWADEDKEETFVWLRR
ncbi:hypothetical protein BDZ85DRAFT_322339 [Elsinoe ampelina]|uniref:F-box domain-containing protein n=1 Tax=Elsinoe ampelina TaxID=302913 RepID=A0A6A6G1F4_9PEZI|nr:hypothetical protein BDZ85DRAFT_322339 [Elsinoe ampelina]